MSEECRHVRVAIGGDPHQLSSATSAHLATCASCRQFHAETVTLDGRVRAALELPLANFRLRAPPARRFALAASLLLAAIVAGGIWLASPQPALAGAVIEHVSHESASWGAHETLSAAELAIVLQKAGVKFDTSMPVVYAMACPFRGRRVPHLVVQTANGPMTVMLLAHVRLAAREEFSESGYHGILLPAGKGSVALLMRDSEVPEAIASQIVNGVRW
jgi:hypothetical protein